MTETDRVGTTNDETYTYDTNGNRTNAGYATRQDNRLRSDGTYTYRYDNEGNLISQIGAGLIREFTWDYRNRLTKVVDKNASGLVTKSVDYTYDALNQRLVKAVDPDGAGAQAATVTRFIYDRDHVALEFTGSTPTRYFYGTGVDQILAMEKANQTTWMLTDHLGSVRQGVNNAGSVTGSLEYNSFGQVVSQTGAVSDWRYRYTGREFDGETGLYYYRARYYDAGVGRFIGQDPLGFEAGDGSNFYAYVNNDPIDRVDPLGLYGKLIYNKNDGKLDQTRYITYFDKGEKYTNNIQDVINAKKKNPKVSIKSDRTVAFIAYSYHATGSEATVSKTKIPGFVAGDNRGHIVGAQLGGLGNDINNLFAQNAYMNQGLWKEYESDVRQSLDAYNFDVVGMRRFLSLCTVDLRYVVDLTYQPSSANLRPIKVQSSAEYFCRKDGYTFSKLPSVSIAN